MSPMLFCIGLSPVSEIINKTVSHLLYMNGIKLCAKTEQDIESLIHSTWIYSNDIVMSFTLETGKWEP